MAVIVQAAADMKGFQDWYNSLQGLAQEVVAEAAAAALTEVARDARRYIVDDIKGEVEEPTAWTLGAVEFVIADPRGGKADEVVSKVRVRDRNRASFAPILDEGYGDRNPGETGPGDTFIFVPMERSLRVLEGVQLKNGTNMPRSTLKRLTRLAGKGGGAKLSKNPRAVAKRAARDAASKHGGVFWGAPKVFGTQMALGFWARPKRIRNDAGLWRNKGAPRLLVRAVPKDHREPFMAAAWKADTTKAANKLQRKLEYHINRRIGRMGGNPKLTSGRRR